MTATIPAGMADDTMLDAAAVARVLGIRTRSIYQYRWEGSMPDPDLTVGQSPAWRWATIRRWATDTGRIRPQREGDHGGDGD